MAAPVRPYPFDLLVVGASAGGVSAIRRLLAGLGAGFAMPVAIVLHVGETRKSHLTTAFAGPLPVREAEDKEPLVPGSVILAPPGYHLLIGDRSTCALSTEAPEHYCRPAIDALFESAADVFGARAAGLLLTGANEDGAAGLRAIEERGGLALVQDPDTAEARTMPAAGLSACRSPRVGEIEQLARWLSGGGP